MRTWTRSMVIVLGVLTATLGVWAGFAPESFYRDGPIPLIDTNWVSLLPPYNEHLVRDYGFVNLGLTVPFLVAAIKLTPCWCAPAQPHCSCSAHRTPHFTASTWTTCVPLTRPPRHSPPPCSPSSFPRSCSRWREGSTKRKVTAKVWTSRWPSQDDSHADAILLSWASGLFARAVIPYR